MIIRETYLELVLKFKAFLIFMIKKYYKIQCVENTIISNVIYIIKYNKGHAENKKGLSQKRTYTSKIIHNHHLN